MKSRGFTLLEVMVSLAILAGALVVIVTSAAGNLANTKRMQQLSLAVDLTRYKMYEIEERLNDPMEGYQSLSEDLHGDFTEEGYPADIKWTAKVEKVKVPGISSLQQLAGADKGGKDGKGGGTGSSPGGNLLGSLLGSFGGGPGEDADMADGSNKTNSNGMSAMQQKAAGQMNMMFEPIKTVLEEGIRKVTVTIKWDTIGGEDSLDTVCFFTDPAAVDRVMAGMGASQGGAVAGGTTAGGTTAGGTTGGTPAPPPPATTGGLP